MCVHVRACVRACVLASAAGDGANADAAHAGCTRVVVGARMLLSAQVLWWHGTRHVTDPALPRCARLRKRLAPPK